MTSLCKKLFGVWKKEKKPYIRFYSLTPGVKELFPIYKSAGLERPYKTAQEYPGVPSPKNCPAINKIVSTGWIVPAPADFSIQTNGDGMTINWLEPYRFNQSSDTSTSSYVMLHGISQTESLVADPTEMVKTVVKLETPWRVDASDDIVLLQMPVTYDKEPRFTAAIGVLDPKYGHTLNIQLFWKVMEGETVVRAGTPLCQFIPIPRSALSSSFYDIEITDANDNDRLRERAFHYAANCVILKHDTLSSRLSRITKILNKYRTGE